MKDLASSQQADAVAKEALLVRQQESLPRAHCRMKRNIQLVLTALLHFQYPCQYPGNKAVENGMSLRRPRSHPLPKGEKTTTCTPDHLNRPTGSADH